MYVGDIHTVAELLELRHMVQRDYLAHTRYWPQDGPRAEQLLMDIEDIEARIYELKDGLS